MSIRKQSQLLLETAAVSIACLTQWIVLAQPHSPKIVWGSVSGVADGVPVAKTLRFSASVTARPGELLSQASPGCVLEGVSGTVLYQVECGNFPTSWQPGDELAIRVEDTSTGQAGDIQIPLNSGAVQNATIQLSAVSCTNTVNLSCVPTAAGTTTGGGEVECRASVTVTATPEPCYTFIDWREGGTVVSTTKTWTFTPTTDRWLAANFALVTYTIETHAEPEAGGRVTGGGFVGCSTEVSLVATANAGYVFGFWTEAGTPVSLNARYTFPATGNRTLVATFRRVSNDAFGDRIQVEGDHRAISWSNANATKEAGEPSHAGETGGRSVWWSWVPPATGRAIFTTAGSTFDTLMGLYTGLSLTDLVVVAWNDDENRAAGIVTSRIVTQVVAGQEYHLAVDGFGGASGSIALEIGLESPVLTAIRVGEDCVLSWATNWLGFVPESSTQITGSPSWHLVPEAPARFGTLYVLTNRPSGVQGFYRLRAE